MDLQIILTVGLLISLFANLQLFSDLRVLHDKSRKALQLAIDIFEDEIDLLEATKLNKAEKKTKKKNIEFKNVEKSLKQAKNVKKSK
jgi:RNA polymerase-interacting CarD/CdnL/TRCF family regulator